MWIMTKNVITSSSVTLTLFLHLEVKSRITLTDVLYLACQLSNWHYVFFSSRRRHTRCSRDWSSDVCSSDLEAQADPARGRRAEPDQPALRVPLPHALRAPGAVVLAERTGAQGGLAGALGRLPGAHGRRD